MIRLTLIFLVLAVAVLFLELGVMGVDSHAIRQQAILEAIEAF